MAEYWWEEKAGEIGHHGQVFELRGALALNFVEHWGMVAGQTTREDQQGRAVLDVMPTEQVIERATSMADQLVASLEARNWIKSTSLTLEERAEQLGRLQKITSDAQYDRKTDEQQVIADLNKQLSEYRRRDREAARAKVEST